MFNNISFPVSFQTKVKLPVNFEGQQPYFIPRIHYKDQIIWEFGRTLISKESLLSMAMEVGQGHHIEGHIKLTI